MVRWFMVEEDPNKRANFGAALIHVDGVDAEMFVTGGELLDRLEGGDLPDLIFLDPELSDLDGSEVIAEIREETATATVPIAMLADTTDCERIDRAYRNGVNIFFPMPSSHDELIRLFTTTRDQWSCALLAR